MEAKPEVTNSNHEANREKRIVAFGSVLAAVFLTSVKIIIGLLTGSLGILSEAAHSGLDLVAAAVTLFAVRVSGHPPDQVHTYGHGKIENLSALFETLLLLLTCVWIIYEAVQRLFFRSVEVEPNIWAFAIMATSIVIDFTRSRALYRVAKKYDSQALEADALHFSTDIWSSSVVIVGLSLVWLSDKFHLPWLAQADSVAAIGVAGIVVYVSIQLGKKTISDLLDAIPPGVRNTVTDAVYRVPGVEDVKRVRVRRSGPEFFADITLTVDREAVLERANEIANQVEAAVLKVLPGADLVVNVAPGETNHEGLISTVRLIAARQGLGVHGIRVYDVFGEHSLEMHVEVSDELDLTTAHDQVTAYEEAIQQALPGISQIVTHIEPIGDASATRRVTSTDNDLIMQALSELPEDTGYVCDIHNVSVHRVGGELSVSFDCLMSAELAIAEAHTLTERVEQLLRARVPNLGRVVIHVEPNSANNQQGK